MRPLTASPQVGCLALLGMRSLWMGPGRCEVVGKHVGILGSCEAALMGGEMGGALGDCEAAMMGR